MTERSGAALSVGETLLHIGPFKTGTTTLQSALHAARDRLQTHRVRYAGRQRQALRAVSAALGKPTPPGWEPFRIEEWQALVEEVTTATDQRVVVSSEFFSDADEDAAVRLTRDLGGPSVRVVVTLRPLASILPSYWQYVVQNGVRAPYQSWLRKTLDRAEEEPTSTFWRRQRHDRLVQRWAKAVGEENVTVVVVDEVDRGMMLRTFESLIGLPEGFLVPDPSSDDNRSLTFGEAELVRKLNTEFKQLGLADTIDGRYLRRGVVRQMRALSPGYQDQRIVTPDWALERCAEIGTEVAANIACSNVRLIGDVATLGRPAGSVPRETKDASGEAAAGQPTGSDGTRSGTPVAVPTTPDVPEQVQQDPRISVELASAAVLGSVRASKPELARRGDDYARDTVSSIPAAPPTDTLPLEHGRVADVRARDLVAVLVGRVRRRIRRKLRRR